MRGLEMNSIKTFARCLLLSFLILVGSQSITMAADPYNLDLVRSNCLAEDITTGPIGWWCFASKRDFIITFFGEKKAGINGTILSVEFSNCNSIEIKELGLTFSELQIKNSREFIGLESISEGDKLSEATSTEIACQYIAPPAPPAVQSTDRD